MTTSSTSLEDAIRTRLLTFAPMGGGATLDTRLGGRLYITEVPDTASYPYAVLWLTRVGGGSDHQERQEAVLELQIVGRPRGTESTLNAAADVAEQALLRWTTTAAQGLIHTTGLQIRRTLPPMDGPADREVVQVQLKWGLIVWPAYLTQYHAS